MRKLAPWYALAFDPCDGTCAVAYPATCWHASYGRDGTCLEPTSRVRGIMAWDAVPARARCETRVDGSLRV